MLHSRYVIIVTICWSLVTIEAFVHNEDICGVQNGRRLYLELGEQGVLHAKNVSFIKNSPRLQDSRIYTTNSSHDQCSLELVTCPSCVITLTFKSIALTQNCGDGSFMLDSPCRCDYVWISEPPYEDVSGTPFCGFYSPISYRSNTRTLSITLLYSQSHNHAFTLEYTSERNRIHLQGSEISPGIGISRNSTSGGTLTSPFFPSRYPRDLGMEYVITCPTEAASCRVRVLFSDFQLAAVSIIEFYDWNGQRLDVSSGVRFRPPIIVSSGPSLLIRFYANGGTGLGYKAIYSFVLGHLYDKSVQPITDCGGYVENLGGAITMVDMVNEGIKIYDCVWLIRPPKTFLHMKTHIYLKILTFDDMAGSTELIIKQGPTSALLPLEILRHPASKLQPRRLKEHIAPISSGFHVSLRGTFGPTSHLAMAYSAFSYTDCFTGSDFLCQNHRCIPGQLNCDGFDHCGDNSDEPSTCIQDWELAPQDRKWHTNKANYYFPKIDHYPDLKTATLVFVASSLGLITLISALIVLLYRMGARARQQREFHSRLQTISELLDGARIEEVTVSDDPPDYESPPGYDEVVKLSLEGENKKVEKKKFDSLCRSNANCTNNYLTERETDASVSILIDGGASTSDSYHCDSSNDSSVQQPIPESPPPPYITPPGTIGKGMNFIGPSDPSEAPAGTFTNEEESARQSWEPTTGKGVVSLPIAATTLENCSSTANAHILGAYLQNYAENLSESSTPQLSSWRGASANINPEFTTRSEGAGIVKDVPEDKKTKTCSCEGACGCSFADSGKDASTSSLLGLQVPKKTAKPRSKKKDKKSTSPGNTIASSVLLNTPSASSASSSPTTSTTIALPTTKVFSVTSASPTLKVTHPLNLKVTPLTQASLNFIEASPTVTISTTSTGTLSTKVSHNPSSKSSSKHAIKGSAMPRVKTSTLSEKVPSASSSAPSEKLISPLPLSNSSTVISTRNVVISSVKISPNFLVENISTSKRSTSTKFASTPVEAHSIKSSPTSIEPHSRKSSPNPVENNIKISLSAPAEFYPRESSSNPVGTHIKKSSSSPAETHLKTSPSNSVENPKKSSSTSEENSCKKTSSSESHLRKSSPFEDTSQTKTLSTSVETHSRKSSSSSSIKSVSTSSENSSPTSSEKSTLSSCALDSFKITRPVKSFSSSSISSLPNSASANLKNSPNSLKNFSEKSLPTPLVKSSSNLSVKPAPTPSVKDSSTPSIKVSSISGVKVPSTTSMKTSPSGSLNASSSSMIDNLASSSSTSAKTAPSTSKVKTSKNPSLKGSNNCPVKSLSTPTSKDSSLSTVPSLATSSIESSKIVPSPVISKISSHPNPASIPAPSTSETNPRNNIIKLFGNSKITAKSPRKLSYSTVSSPGSTISKSFMQNSFSRKFSICSHDSYATKLSALSASSSYEKLHDDFEILSQCSSTFDLNTPINTPKFNKGSRALSLPRTNYINYDIEGLYEGIKILDSFIAKNERNMKCTKNSSIAATIFGTPRHVSKRAVKNRDKMERKRFWRSMDDNSIIYALPK